MRALVMSRPTRRARPASNKSRTGEAANRNARELVLEIFKDAHRGAPKLGGDCILVVQQVVQLVVAQGKIAGSTRR